ncbi:carbohydrate ABC transporter permease [Streptomyces sp. bgisy031]|uniref:carbohydrate ABC transporter permease n=1 Tax=Streptomyces sp. bgisy031 TaxID=3413772 RepID=UPI003D71E1E6
MTVTPTVETGPAAMAAGPAPRPAPSGRRSRRSHTADASGAALHRSWWLPYIWVAPAIAAATMFGIWPFLNTVMLSFTDAKPLGGPAGFVGTANYRRLLTDTDFWLATKNSVLYLIVVVPLMMLLPLLLAVLVEKKVPGIGFFRAAYYTPVVASVVVVGFSWQYLLRDDGTLNTLLLQAKVLREPLPFLSDATLLLFCCMAMTVWKGLGWYLVFYLAALGNVPKELHEAAAVDGAGWLRRFWHITVPGVRPTMLLVGTLAAIGSLRVFTEIYMLGGATGGPGGQARTIPFYIRDTGLDPMNGNAGYGAAVSIALFLMTVGFTLLGRRLSKGDENQ